MGMKERWLPVVGYEGWYEVSDLGRVRRVAPGGRTVPGKILSAKVSRDRPGSYPMVGLSRPGQRVIRHVHVIVATAFLGPRPKGHEINHRNLNKTDNSLRNLHYVTRAENIRHRARMKRHCLRGHPLFGDSVWRDSDGHRHCRACMKVRG